MLTDGYGVYRAGGGGLNTETYKVRNRSLNHRCALWQGKRLFFLVFSSRQVEFQDLFCKREIYYRKTTIFWFFSPGNTGIEKDELDFSQYLNVNAWCKVCKLRVNSTDSKPQYFKYWEYGRTCIKRHRIKRSPCINRFGCNSPELFYLINFIIMRSWLPLTETQRLICIVFHLNWTVT